MAVFQNDDTGKFDFLCEYPAGQCAPFLSQGWDTEAQAEARGAEHVNEHETGELMQDLHAFQESVGFGADIIQGTVVKGSDK